MAPKETGHLGAVEMESKMTYFKPSRTAMRRAVKAAGGFYIRNIGVWVIPGSMHNCTPWMTQPQRFSSLEEAYDASFDAREANRRVQEFGEAEFRYQRKHF